MEKKAKKSMVYFGVNPLLTYNVFSDIPHAPRINDAKLLLLKS